MPFKSLSQLRTCYGKNDPRWNCKEFLNATPSVCCLPEKTNETPKCRYAKKDIVRKTSKVQTGPRGGKYVIITEKNKKTKKVICKKKVYVK